MNITKKKKEIMTRKYVMLSLLLMIAGGLLFGCAIFKCFEVANLASVMNVSICVIIYTLICIFFWLPLIVPMDKIMKIDDQAVYIMAKHSNWKKIRIAIYALLNNNIEIFYRRVQFSDIDKMTFTFDAHWGSYAYQRFSYVLVMHIGKETIKIFLNPQQNGFIVPSGNGLPFAGVMAKEDIVNLVDYFKRNEVKVNDPYKLEEAMKDEKIVMYDYMVSIHKKIIF